MRKCLVLLCVFLLLLSSYALAEEVGEEFEEDFFEDAEESLYDEEFDTLIEEDIYDDIGDVELEGDAGLTPDDTFYFLEDLVETVLVGDDPEKALSYKEEKILELKEMIESGNTEASEKALARVEKYNKIIKKEVSPDIEKKVRSSSKAVKKLLSSLDLEGAEWDDIQEAINENLKEEDKIALAAKISTKISELCEALSALDPLEYSKACRTGADDPEWKRDLDERLTAEQREEAEEFFEIMSECFQNPAECRCDDISIAPFAEQCNVIAPLAAACESGDEVACEEMEGVEDPIDLLPDYLQDILEDVEDRYGDAKHDLHIPSECVAEGALSREACMKVMFKVHAPPECLEALESGEINPQNEHEAREACEDIMFQSEAPSECIEAGLTDFSECERMMFRLDAPEECIEAGLTGTGRDDWRKCDAIRFKLDAPQECLDAGFDGTGRDDWKKCDAIRFQMDSPQECLDAGLDGTGRDDWKKCNKIEFLLDAPEECHKFADDRDPWRACQPVQFALDAPQECLDAGLDGTGRDDWRKCEKIRFALEAPPECIAAGLDGTGRDDWRKCDDIRVDDGAHRPVECFDDQIQMCDDQGNCWCESDDYDYGDDHDDYEDKDKDDYDDGNNLDCAVIYCGEGTECIDGIGCIPNDDYNDGRDDHDDTGDDGSNDDSGDDRGSDDDSSDDGSADDSGSDDDFNDDNSDSTNDDNSGEDNSGDSNGGGSDNIAGDAGSDGGSDNSGGDSSDSNSGDSGGDDSGSDASGSNDGGGEITGAVVGDDRFFDFFDEWFG